MTRPWVQRSTEGSSVSGEFNKRPNEQKEEELTSEKTRDKVRLWSICLHIYVRKGATLCYLSEEYKKRQVIFGVHFYLGSLLKLC